jgi:hypothetical protein
MSDLDPSASVRVRLVLAVAVLGLGSAIGCPAPDPQVVATAVPLVDRALDRTYARNAGLVTGLGAWGWPVREGTNMDPAIVEARRFYDTVKAPGLEVHAVDYPDPFTGAAAAPKITAPTTFETWKRTFGFPARGAGESMEAFRERAGVVVYFNKNELGLGRELGCTEFKDGQGPDGHAATGIACYVTNYGTAFRDVHSSLAAAVEGASPKNTVCITYQPSREPGYEVQFYTYGHDGRRQEWAQLDTLGPRPHPQVCMNCHGGAYDEARHLARNARFLPMDPNVVTFASGPTAPPGSTRAAQEERIRRINALALRTPLTPGQREMIHELYAGKHESAGIPSATTWFPAGWRGTAEDRDLFDQVVKPYCATCHLAMDKGLDDSTLFSYRLFESRAALVKFPVEAVVCGTFSMPNAQATSLNFWDPDLGAVTVGERKFPTAADALLGALGKTRRDCANLDRQATCLRSPEPDSICGNDHSGTACRRHDGRCVPFLGPRAPADPMAPNGFCRTDGRRACPYPQECRKADQPLDLEGFDGVCITCGKRGQPSCLGATSCEQGLRAEAGRCLAP